MLISLIGTWIQTVAQSWLVFQLTHSTFLLGLVGFLGSLPVFLLSLFGGVVADRINKRSILIFTQCAFMVLAFSLGLLTQRKLITPPQIMFIAVLNGIVMAFDAPTRQAFVVELVGRENLLNAIALNSVAFNSSRVIGPAVCGILVASIGMSGCFYINAITFLAVIIALLLIRFNNISRKKVNSLLDDLLEGLSFIRKNRVILVLITMVAITSLFGISYVVFMPVFAHEILKVGIKGLGLLMSAAGAGALFAGLMLARTGDFKYKGSLLILSTIIFSLSLVLFSLSKIYLLSLIALIIVGGASVTAISLINTLLQVLVPDELRGRLLSVFMFTFAGIMPLGSLIAGTLAHFIGVSLTIFIGAVTCTVFFITINILYPEIRNIRESHLA